ncbi:MAG TPA: hypothetical protein VJX69_05570 [Terriglobales bacterium]|nr:hypothetical protein [Terriglobales bacterium]
MHALQGSGEIFPKIFNVLQTDVQTDDPVTIVGTILVTLWFVLV